MAIPLVFQNVEGGVEFWFDLDGRRDIIVTIFDILRKGESTF